MKRRLAFGDELLSDLDLCEAIARGEAGFLEREGDSPKRGKRRRYRMRQQIKRARASLPSGVLSVRQSLERAL